jgi:hypothetical protein
MPVQTANDPLRKTEIAPPYCSDPNCEYCSELRETQKQISAHEDLHMRTDDDSS